MKRKDLWKSLSAGQKLAVILRDIGLYAVLFSALPHVLADYDNAVLVLICLPLSAVSQATLSWKENRKLSLFFLFAAVFVLAMYCVSALN